MAGTAMARARSSSATCRAEARELVEATQLAMMAGIAAAKAGNRVGDISAAVEDIGRAHGFGIVRPFVGHGIGTEMHQDPQVPNYRTGSRGPELQPGMCLAIEPMFTLGDGDVFVEADGWTVSTADDALAAHFEHTIAITANGPADPDHHHMSTGNAAPRIVDTRERGFWSGRMGTGRAHGGRRPRDSRTPKVGVGRRGRRPQRDRPLPRSVAL